MNSKILLGNKIKELEGKVKSLEKDFKDEEEQYTRDYLYGQYKAYQLVLKEFEDYRNQLRTVENYID